MLLIKVVTDFQKGYIANATLMHRQALIETVIK